MLQNNKDITKYIPIPLSPRIEPFPSAPSTPKLKSIENVEMFL
jgi:hypothetical protein